MRIVGGSVFGPDYKMHDMDLCFENGVITEKSQTGEFDASGCFVLPGLIDTHVHGAAGIEFYMTGQDITPALDWLASQGITGVLVTTACDHPEALVRDIQNVLKNKDSRVLGIHSEGPFVNPVKKGGLLEDRIQKPNAELVRLLHKESGGMIKIMTMSPELEGIEEVIDCCKELGIQVSMGHSEATYECAGKAVDRGASRMTHTFNAMRGYDHREPGVLGRGLDDDRVTCELICDLFHVSAPAIRLVIKAKGVERVTMISDCSLFCGRGDGDYEFNGRIIYVRDGLCRLGNGTICGSSKCLTDGAKNLYHMGYLPEEIAIMASVNPAKACGCTDRGEFKPGYRADVVVFDQNFDIKAVFLGGERIA